MYLWKQSKQSRAYVEVVHRLIQQHIPVQVVDVFKYRSKLKHITDVPTVIAFGATGESYMVSPEDMWEVDKVKTIMQLQSLTVRPQDIPQEALVLYYYQECPYCQGVASTMVDLQKEMAVPVLAINTRKHPNTFKSLKHPSRTVPYIVYHDGENQVPFTGNRTVEELRQFVDTVQGRLQGGSNHSTLDARSVSPSDVKPGTFVLYYMPGCGFCQEFAPVFEAFAQEHSTATINVDDYPEVVEELSDELEGVPHLVYVDVNGGRHVFDEDDRTMEQLGLFASLSKLVDVEVSDPSEVKEGLLLYFRPDCGFCQMFFPDFVALMDKGVSIFALNTTKYPQRHIHGVPHVEYRHQDQVVVYQGPRTTQELMSFVQEQQKSSVKKVRFEGGGGDCLRLEDAIRSLNDEVGKMGYPDLFSPRNASVCFTGVATSAKSIKLDRMYVMFVPKEDVLMGRYPVFGVAWGKRGSCFQTKLYKGSQNPKSLIERKMNAGYRRMQQTHPVVHELRELGYLTRVDAGRKSAVY
ncbi:MAG: hypothetical protein K0U52_00845 [Gammaproteobacteria bacterium]|nr:hypothetical protein [Gammaproteobacteria bacterium]